ncbi:hypothetical protein [Streptomyces sp. NPDC057253]|uniref:hypothetical protein n=1 Tax=Streptomyces sp. NPDC057253 TaxID=3346069 RepID=UPI0036379349
MSNTEEPKRDPQDVARETLLDMIVRNAEATTKLNPGNAAEALKNLSEAYAFIASPAQPH